MQSNWWKILGAILVLYSIIAGLSVPLNPGIKKISPSKLKTGQNQKVLVSTYNISEKTNQKFNAYIRCDSVHSISSVANRVISNNLIEFEFNVPPHFDVQSNLTSASFILTTGNNYAVLPDALILEQSNQNSETTIKWQEFNISVPSPDAITFPYRNIIVETIRNLYYHVPMWFAMFALFFLSVIRSSQFLKTGKLKYDYKVCGLTHAGVFLGILGLVTGMVWAKFTWGAYWSWDIKQNMSAVSLLIYFAYFILRGSIDDRDKRARLSGIYNIFAFCAMVPLLFVLPRLTDSLHPGNGGNPALGSNDLDNTMRLVFYPAVIGWILIGYWLATVKSRIEKLNESIIYG